MKLRKVISGGQTGVDKTALICARELGLETGGTAPKGWKIDGGTDPSLKDYGLVESDSSDYKPRTHKNAADADATLWFGKTSPGYWCTLNGCKKAGKPFYVNPLDGDLEQICNKYEVINVAGNRARINPEAMRLVKNAFQVIGELR